MILGGGTDRVDAKTTSIRLRNNSRIILLTFVFKKIIHEIYKANDEDSKEYSEEAFNQRMPQLYRVGFEKEFKQGGIFREKDKTFRFISHQAKQSIY